MDSDLELDYYEEDYPHSFPLLKDISNKSDADITGRPIPVKVGTKKSHPCPICDVRAKVIKRHAIRSHFPKVLDQNHVTETELVCIYKAILHFFCEELNTVDCMSLLSFTIETEGC